MIAYLFWECITQQNHMSTDYCDDIGAAWGCNSSHEVVHRAKAIQTSMGMMSVQHTHTYSGSDAKDF